jgi:CsoR family transcriptional regulator, copper-sensing transcriptional repressor
MLEEDRYCIDIITQIDAVKAALNRVEDEILRDHVSHCVEQAIASGDKADQRQKIAELIEVLAVPSVNAVPGIKLRVLDLAQ